LKQWLNFIKTAFLSRFDKIARQLPRE